MTLYENPENRPLWWPDNLQYSHDSLFKLGEFDSWGPETTPEEPMAETMMKAFTAECMLDAVSQVSLFIIA